MAISFKSWWSETKSRSGAVTSIKYDGPINAGWQTQSVPKTIELTGHLGQWQALIYWPKPGFTGPNNWHNTISTKIPHASRASGRALFISPTGNWLANGVGPVLISQTANRGPGKAFPPTLLAGVLETKGAPYCFGVYSFSLFTMFNFNSWSFRTWKIAVQLQKFQQVDNSLGTILNFTVLQSSDDWFFRYCDLKSV